MPKTKTNNDFFSQVYEVVKLIPTGRVTSYGAIAAYLGAKRSSRMVGWALNKIDFFDDSIPAHRVVNSKGELSGRNAFPTPETMQARLEAEGMTIKKWKIQNFDEHYWHPQELDEG